MRARTLQLGAASFYADAADRYCVTRFADALQVPARPHDTLEYRETARRLGYSGDVWTMCRDHEAIHTLASMVLFGLPASPTLRHVAGGEAASLEWRNLEEAVVCYLQRTLNGLERAYGRLGDVVEACGCLRRGEGVVE